RLPIAAGDGVIAEGAESTTLAAPTRSRGAKRAGKGREASRESSMGGAAPSVGAPAGAAGLREGAADSPRAEYLGSRTPFSPPQGGVKEWPGTVLSPVEPAPGIF